MTAQKSALVIQSAPATITIAHYRRLGKGFERLSLPLREAVAIAVEDGDLCGILDRSEAEAVAHAASARYPAMVVDHGPGGYYSVSVATGAWDVDESEHDETWASWDRAFERQDQEAAAEWDAAIQRYLGTDA